VITLSLDDVLELLGAPTIAGDLRQMEKLRKWVEGLLTAHGEDYVRQNKRNLISQWEQHVKGAFSSCL
jgi:hypothetical protein